MSKHVQSVNAGSVGSLVARAGIAAAAVLVLAAGVHAQWLPDYQRYEVKRAGLFGPAHTHPVTGAQESLIKQRDEQGRFTGRSLRLGADGGADSWYWDGRNTQLISVGGADHFTTAGYRFTHALHMDETGLVAGSVQRYSATNGMNGLDIWGWKSGVAVQISLDGGPYRGSGGKQQSTLSTQKAPGFVIGTTDRLIGTQTPNGANAWVWDGQVVHVPGFFGPGFTSTTGYQLSEIQSQSGTGKLAGGSLRFTPTDTSNGRVAWLWDGATTEIGLVDPEYVGSAGYRDSRTRAIIDSGQVAGTAFRIRNVATTNGQDAWVASAGATTRIGFVDPANTGSDGYRYSEIVAMNQAGLVTGYTNRITGVNTNNGRDGWVWQNGVTTRLGFAGPGYTGSNGYQYSHPVAPAINPAGQVMGFSERVTAAGVRNGQDAWIWKNGATTQIGLTGGVFEGTLGYRFSAPKYQNAAGQVVGTSLRVLGESTYGGESAWVWSENTTTQIGLTGDPYVSLTGLQLSSIQKLNEHGHVWGMTVRYLGGSSARGANGWVWNGEQTVMVGLVSADHTRGDGTQSTSIPANGFNAAGVLAGVSIRYGVSEDDLGQDVWYFDPATGITHDVLAGVPGRVRTADGYGFAEIGAVTDQGVLVGTYMFFASGTGGGEERAFAFRPDLGFTHLESLVVNGIGAYGWDALQHGEHAVGLEVFIGYGRTTGLQSRGVFVMTEIDCLADFDGSGSATIDDLFQFMNAWFMGDPRADANRQNGVTIDDLFIFLNAWFTGC